MIEIEPLRHCDGVITIPGSKSYTHRALILSSLADGESILMNALRCEDTEHTVQALIKFGIPIFWEGGGCVSKGKEGSLKRSMTRLI